VSAAPGDVVYLQDFSGAFSPSWWWKNDSTHVNVDGGILSIQVENAGPGQDGMGGPFIEYDIWGGGNGFTPPEPGKYYELSVTYKYVYTDGVNDYYEARFGIGVDWGDPTGDDSVDGVDYLTT
jgi:hypothetical protein